MILAFDIGTTSLKAAVVDEKYRVVEFASKKSEILYPKKGWAEIDPERLWSDIAELASQLNVNPEAVIFSPHMAGVVPVDAEGNALRNAMIWLDERAAGLPREVFEGFPKIHGYNAFKLLKFLRITGGAPSKTGKDPISKIVWLRENEPDVFAKTTKILDVKGYLIARSCGEFVTSPDEANLTWLADTRGGKARWSGSLLRDFGIDAKLMPAIRSCASIAGMMSRRAASDLGMDPAPVIVGAGDLTAAAVGSGAVEEGKVHVYIGTSDWVAAHVAERKVDVSHYIGSILSAIDGRYLLVAEQEVAAGALEWAMRMVGIDDYSEIKRLIKCETSVLFLPWMYGERAPIDDPHVRAAFLNLSLDSSEGEVLRAVMEGVALNIKWAYGYVERLVGRQEIVNVVGGGTLFDEWCQILADAIARPVRRMNDPQHAGLRGSAAIAYVALGRETFESAAAKFEVDRIFKPANTERYDRLLKLFVDAYKKLRRLYRVLNP